MILEIKQKFFEILTSTLGYSVYDNPQNDNTTYPWIRFSLGNITRDTFQDNFVYSYHFYIDIFSNYDGEKEILEMEESIFEELQQLYEIEGVTYIRENSFKILDDKSLGPVRKHGAIKYTILCNGKIKED